MSHIGSALEQVFATPAVRVVRREHDTLLSSRHALGAYARCSGEYLEDWATRASERPFVLERRGGSFRGLTYGEMRELVWRVGAWLLARGLSPATPLVILSENSVEHALLTLACLHVGVPVAPLSPAYSLVSKDFNKLRRILGSLKPSLVYVSDAPRFTPALAAVADVYDGLVVSGDGTSAGRFEAFEALKRGRDDGAVERAYAAVRPETVAKVMFTSGSTSEPKGVINTHRMLCSNQQAIAQIWRLLAHPPVLLDWLPWHHTYGGNHNFNMVLRNGGTLYIDEGRPVPGHFDATLANLREVAPTLSLNVPRAYDMLVSALRADDALCRQFFSKLELMFYAGAALPQHLWEALRELARGAVGHDLPMVSSWGLTETAPTATVGHFQPERAGVIGLPLPGCELKLVPVGDKTEVRVRGPNVTPGYFGRPDLSADCFDEELFFKTGDAVRFVDVERPERGLLFDGRIGEDFKLSTATWVSVGTLRLESLAALAPLAQDAVVTGHDRDEVGLLIFPNISACRRLCEELPSDAPVSSVLESSAVRAHVAASLAALTRGRSGSSTCARRALLLSEPASIDAGEITDKGYINQRAVLTRRAELVEMLYRDPPHPSVIVPQEPRASGPRV